MPSRSRPSGAEWRLSAADKAARDPHSPEALRRFRGWDVRLVPVAAAAWGGAGLAIAVRSWWVVVAIITVAGLVFAATSRRGSVTARARWTVLAAGGSSVIASALTQLRVVRVDHSPLLGRTGSGPLVLEVSGSPKRNRDGGVTLPVDLPTVGEVPLFVRPSHRGEVDLLGLQPGTEITVRARLAASERAELVPYTLSTTSPVGEAGTGVTAEPTGLLGLTASIRRGLATAAEHLPGERGLIIPGMVTGDTSMQPTESRQEFIASGLSHLTAVSGSNVAVVTGTAVIIAATLRVPRVWRYVVAAAALAGFVLVVGPEPSVLRAAIMGWVGLVAVVASKWGDILAALSLATIVLTLLAPSVVTSYAFVLSVTATAGIVMLSPWWARRILRVYAQVCAARWDRHVSEAEAMAVRLLCVTVAADLCTIPIIVHMSGEVSLVAVPANMAVSWAVPLVTIVGLLVAPLCAVVVALGAPGWAVACFVAPVLPLAWWIGEVAEALSRAPYVHTGGGVWWAVVATILLSGAVECAVWWRWWRAWRWPAVVVLAGLVLLADAGLVDVAERPQPGWAPAPVTVEPGEAVVVGNDEEALALEDPPRVVVVTACGPPKGRPSVLPNGSQVVYPCADGAKVRGVAADGELAGEFR